MAGATSTSTSGADWRGTNDPRLKSWVESANDPSCDFPIQNLPYGVFFDANDPAPRVGVAIGNVIVDLAVLDAEGLLELPPLYSGEGDAPASDSVFDKPCLNDFIALGRDAWRALRTQLSALLARDTPTLRDNRALRERALVAQRGATLLLPVEIPGYTDFYSSKEHATNIGSMFRDPKNALMPNWLEIPIGYNGRASSVVVSGSPVRRPNGQLKLPDRERPVFGPCRKLDIELETGFFVGVGNALGEPIPCAEADDHIFGMVLLNDWSARDIQQWEYQPLGPFNAKGFATTISPWVVTLDALAPFRVEQPVQQPEPLPYLRGAANGGVELHLEASIRPHGVKEATTIARTNLRHMYWTMAQQLAHHTASGCNMRVGDLMGSGTVSGPADDAHAEGGTGIGTFGSLLELTWNGRDPLTLAGGATRTFIEDGDELTLTGWCQGDGYRIGFGRCSGTVLPALKLD
jgi:fumarylacetoacetase